MINYLMLSSLDAQLTGLASLKKSFKFKKKCSSSDTQKGTEKVTFHPQVADSQIFEFRRMTPFLKAL